MRYRNVCLEAFGYTLPDEIVTSAADRSAARAALRPAAAARGTAGIDDRHPRAAVLAARHAAQHGQRRQRPSRRSRPRASTRATSARWSTARSAATISSRPRPAACITGLGLPAECLIYDVSNACLGLLNGMVQVANMIELGRFARASSSAPRTAGRSSKRRSHSSTPTRRSPANDSSRPWRRSRSARAARPCCWSTAS